MTFNSPAVLIQQEVAFVPVSTRGRFNLKLTSHDGETADGSGLNTCDVLSFHTVLHLTVTAFHVQHFCLSV